MVSSLLSLGTPLPSLVYCLALIRAASQKYPQWASTQRYHFSVATSVNPAPSLETLYTTLHDHFHGSVNRILILILIRDKMKG
ncbi:BgtTE-56029 [Blumeria graminis f. sp. tritici]|uniref:BgtTE-56029 n=1 Tax=Blumeria graminis f. sp. tritici TaxID=62690 RepID=A0A9X9LCB5_BLUGR|nr:BgtTE-56029 [Blumeria graminis f. sp. tritici]